MRTIPHIVPPTAMQDATTLYDFFMNIIEPDLVSANLSILDTPYIGERKDQHKERYVRYAASFQRCKEVMREFVKSAEDEAKNVIRRMNVAVEAEEKVEVLASLSKNIQDL